METFKNIECLRELRLGIYLLNTFGFFLSMCLIVLISLKIELRNRRTFQKK